MAARIDEEFPDHPKVVGLGDRAFRLHIVALCFCAQNLTDGHLSKRTLTILRAKTAANAKHVGELVNAGLWDPAHDGYVIHDYLAKNKPRDDVLREREDARVRMAELRKRRCSDERSDEHSPERSPVRSVTQSLTLKDQSQRPLPAQPHSVRAEGRFRLTEHDVPEPLGFQLPSSLRTATEGA